MPRYRKKPVEIEAWQWNGSVEGATILIDLILERGGTARYHEEEQEWDREEQEFVTVPAHIAIDTLEGTMRLTNSDFLIQGIQGEFYPCKADIFHDSYDLVVDIAD